jgi:hypothetical protein
MCGPSSQEKQLEAQQAQFSGTLQQDFLTRFAGQDRILSNLNNTLTSLSQGKLLPGFDASTLAALNTAAINTTGKNYANAARAVGGQLAGRGGDSGLVSGVDQQIKAGIASSAAGQLSTQQQQIQLANQAQSEKNTAMYLGGVNALAGEENPLGFAGAGTQANQSAFGEAHQISQENNQMVADIAGGVAGIAGMGLTGIAGGINAAPGQSFGSGFFGVLG